MFDFYAGLIKALISVILVAVGYGFKVLGDRRHARIAKEEREEQSWRDQRQRYWSPLLQSAREFSSRLEDLSHIYRTDKVWEESLNMFTPEGLSGDFRELYALSRDPIQDLIGSDDPNERRRSEAATQKVRTRMCYPLNFATSSLYRAARYLALAGRAQRALNEGEFDLPNEARDEMLRLVLNVRQGLAGKTGAGIFIEQQESLAELMWEPAGRVITNFEFRKRLLELPGWEQFTALLIFFLSEDDNEEGVRARFRPKLCYEVKATIKTLRALEMELARLCSSRSKVDYHALWRSR
jgi:hypothetical protein